MHKPLTLEFIIVISILLSLWLTPRFRGKPPVIPKNKKKFYDEYIQSEAWQKKRKVRIKMDGGKCANFHLIPKRKDLQVHHKTYKRLGDESVRRDLITLCRKCHNRIHRNDKTSKNICL